MIRARFEKRLPLFSLRADFCATDATTILWGDSGAGKTTILDCIAGLCSPDSGDIILDGGYLFSSSRGVDLPPRERRIGYVFQDYALFPQGEKRRAAEFLERFGLARLKSSRPGELSGGERQRLALARALATKPRLLLLDEPFNALDRVTKEATRREYLALRDELGVCSILVTPSKAEADLLGQRVIEIREG
ncbi:ATP-binding cassette domain-containing protein, partial [bacterium]|nr:ATP-binding cassette domain-containing protein [bacterium]